MISNGRATREEISQSFHIPARSISRWMDVFTKDGAGCFYRKKNKRAHVSSPPKQ
jgi:hypothetical protein